MEIQQKLLVLGTNCQDLSAAVWTEHLWLASDETMSLERLSPSPTGYDQPQQFPLTEYLDLVDDTTGAGVEVDIEGLDYQDHYLWLVGSHATKRKRVRPDRSDLENIRRLTKIEADPNRYLLARIPLVDGILYKTCPHPSQLGEQLTAAAIGRTKLLTLLEEDPHLGPFLTAGIPGKDNGFDVEGLAVMGNKVWLGLRGPVLRGWAILLELTVEARGPGLLRFRRGADGLAYRKHFLDLGGLGIRELCRDGDDLLILAGPTMILQGVIRVFRLVKGLLLAEPSLITQQPGRLEVLFETPPCRKIRPGRRHCPDPRGIARGLRWACTKPI
nr:DUF3616 domain-containing protein [Candidatus Cyanaurora vandensis]